MADVRAPARSSPSPTSSGRSPSTATSLGFEVEAIYDDPPYATLVLAGDAAVARRAGTSGRGPPGRDDDRARGHRRRPTSCSCVEVDGRTRRVRRSSRRGARASSPSPTSRRGAAAASSASTPTATSSRSSSPREGGRPPRPGTTSASRTSRIPSCSRATDAIVRVDAGGDLRRRPRSAPRATSPASSTGRSWGTSSRARSSWRWAPRVSLDPARDQRS